jgi:hypothetical protein
LATRHLPLRACLQTRTYQDAAEFEEASKRTIAAWKRAASVCGCRHTEAMLGELQFLPAAVRRIELTWAFCIIDCRLSLIRQGMSLLISRWCTSQGRSGLIKLERTHGVPKDMLRHYSLKLVACWQRHHSGAVDGVASAAAAVLGVAAAAHRATRRPSMDAELKRS